jgi:uncharacterized membrane protein
VLTLSLRTKLDTLLVTRYFSVSVLKLPDFSDSATVRACEFPIFRTAMHLTFTPGIAITEGGVIPATLVYLGGFYKSTELATRLAWFWGVQVFQKLCLATMGLTSFSPSPVRLVV